MYRGTPIPATPPVEKTIHGSDGHGEESRQRLGSDGGDGVGNKHRNGTEKGALGAASGADNASSRKSGGGDEDGVSVRRRVGGDGC